MPLATVDEVARGWRTLSDDQRADAEDMIAAAEAWIRDPSRRPDIADGDPIAKRVVIEVVRSAMSVPAEFTGHTSYSKTVGPWSRSGTVPTPAGLLVFTDEQQQRLGITVDEPTPIGEFGNPEGYRYPPPWPVLP